MPRVDSLYLAHSHLLFSFENQVRFLGSFKSVTIPNISQDVVEVKISPEFPVMYFPSFFAGGDIVLSRGVMVGRAFYEEVKNIEFRKNNNYNKDLLLIILKRTKFTNSGVIKQNFLEGRFIKLNNAFVTSYSLSEIDSLTSDVFLEEITMRVEWIEDLGDKKIVGNNILASDNNSDLKNSERFIIETFGSAISKVFSR